MSRSAPPPRVGDINNETMATLTVALSNMEGLLFSSPADPNLGREVAQSYRVSVCMLAFWKFAFPAPVFVRRDISACQRL